MKYKNNYILNKSTRAGFTLIEVLVSVSLFVTIITFGMGALFSAQSVNAKLQADQTVLDGMNVSFETMTRDIRYGTLFNCAMVIPDDEASIRANILIRRSCPFSIGGPSNTAGNAIVFRPVDAANPDDRIGYYATSSKIYKWVYSENVIQDPIPITADEVSVDSLQFFVTGANTTQQAIDNGNTENGSTSPTDVLQPVVNVMVSGRTSIQRKSGGDVKFQIETTVAPRGIDN